MLEHLAAVKRIILKWVLEEHDEVVLDSYELSLGTNGGFI
jgi:hypothetical protein